MEQCIMNSDGLNALVSQLGCEFDGTFIVTDETIDALDEIQKLVQSENIYFRSTRRHLALSNVIEKSLVPLILYVCEDDDDEEEEEDDSFLTEDEKKSIYSKAINLLMSLTLPLECLNSTGDRYDMPHHIPEKIREDVSKLYGAAKQAFLSFRICNAILHTSKKLIQPLHEGKQLDTNACQALNYTILLLRNILFLPDTHRRLNEPDAHISILRLLFKSGLSDIILDLLSSEQHQYWCVSLVQLISLLYKDQKYIAKEFVYDDTSPCVHTTGSGATVCTDGSFWWCSNDTCSEKTTTSRTEDDRASGELSNESTLKGSDSIDDSKDGSGNSSQDSTLNGICPPHNSEDSVEHPYGTVTSEAVQAMSERLLNLERSVNCKLVYWQVNEELLSFTEALLHRGFSNLIISLKTLLITNESNGLSSLYFTWIIAHFLRLARQIKAPFSVLRVCLTVDIVGYLVYLGVSSAEDIIVNHARNMDVKHASRSNHLVVRALYEVLLIIRYVDHKKLSSGERHLLRTLLGHLIRIKDLRQLFLLFIRHFSLDIVSAQHLADVACTNHQFLIVAEGVLSWESFPQPFNMLAHVDSFATTDIMCRYGDLLERYEENSHEVNECVLTLMHHVAGDCDKHEILLQFPIIRKMAEIGNYPSLSVESQDLSHFLMQRFIALASKDPFQCSQYLFSNARNTERMDEEDTPEVWQEEEMDNLFQLHAEYAGKDNMLNSIMEGLQENNIFKSKQEIVVKLYTQGLLSPEELEALSVKDETNSMMEADGEKPKPEPIKTAGSISDCIEQLKKQDLGEHLSWVQDLLLELCSIKLGGRSLSNCEIAEDPVPLYYAIQGKSIPFVAYTQEQEEFLRNDDFIQLLKLMGFHLAEDSGQFFPRIPHFWTPEDLLFKAQQLGSVDMEKQKFTMKDVEANANWWTNHMTPQAAETTAFNYDDTMEDKEHQSGDLWHVFVRQCNISPHLNNLKNKIQQK